MTVTVYTLAFPFDASCLQPVGGYWRGIKQTHWVLLMITDLLKVHTYYSPLFSADSRPRCESFPSSTCSALPFTPGCWCAALSANHGRPASMWWQICGRRERLHPHVAFWKMPTAHSVKLRRYEHAQQRRSSRHGNIARLYAGCSPPQTPPTPRTLIYRF